MKRAAITVSTICFFIAAFLIPGRSGVPVTQRYVSITTDLYCIQIDKSEMDAIEQEISFHFDPPDGKVLLTKEERVKLLDAIKTAESAEILGHETFSLMPGCGFQKHRLDEVRYPIIYEPGPSDKRYGLKQRGFQTREIGLMTHFTVTSPPDSDLITMTCFYEMCGFLGWKKLRDDVSQPVFKSWSQSMTMVIPDKMTYVSRQIAPYGFNNSLVLDEKSEQPEKKTKCCIFILSVGKMQN